MLLNVGRVGMFGCREEKIKIWKREREEGFRRGRKGRLKWIEIGEWKGERKV